MRTVPLATASNGFGFALWSRARATPGNLALSPASLSAALATTWGGAAGETAAELKQVLRIEGDAGAAMAGWGKLATELQDASRSFRLRIANRLFAAQRYKLEAAYVDRLRATYGTQLETLDFEGAPEPARVHINMWVERKTERRIKDLLPPGAIAPETRLALVNALYFRGDWQEPFNKDNTTEQPFTVAPGKTRPAMMMCRRGDYAFAKAGGVSIVALPYTDGDATMVIVLPDKIDGLDAVERSLDPARLAAWTGALKHREVLVWLPRFAIDPPEAVELGAQLQALGMARAFDRARADFTWIANPPDPGERLCIDRVFHKAFVKVDERGTEAAAATIVEMMGIDSIPSPVPELKADHPFLFFILDEATGLVLFMGRVADPTAP